MAWGPRTPELFYNYIAERSRSAARVKGRRQSNWKEVRELVGSIAIPMKVQIALYLLESHESTDEWYIPNVINSYQYSNNVTTRDDGSP